MVDRALDGTQSLRADRLSPRRMPRVGAVLDRPNRAIVSPCSRTSPFVFLPRLQRSRPLYSPGGSCRTTQTSVTSPWGEVPPDLHLAATRQIWLLGLALA